MGLLSLPEDCSKDQRIEIYVKLRVWDRESGNEAKGFKVTAEQRALFLFLQLRRTGIQVVSSPGLVYLTGSYHTGTGWGK